MHLNSKLNRCTACIMVQYAVLAHVNQVLL